MSQTGATHTMPDGTVMDDADMAAMTSDSATSVKPPHPGSDDEPEAQPAPGRVTHRDAGPSDAAAMICSLEIAEAVRSAFALPEVPQARDAWVDRTYRCTYRLPHSSLTLRVKDLDRAAPGRAWFDRLSGRLDGATPIKGLQALGFPAVETPGPVGSVAFLKDHKTLWVDASRVSVRDLPAGFSRTGTAYNVASHVIACWME